jgi:hypothetical protein
MNNKRGVLPFDPVNVVAVVMMIILLYFILGGLVWFL